MSEPSTYGCEVCSVSYRMGSETHIFLYLKQPWFDHLVTVCPKCHNSWGVWQLTEATIKYLIDNNIEPGDEVQCSVVDFAGDEVVKAFCQATGLPYPKERFLSPRQQQVIDNECGMFRFLLERGEMV